MKWGVFPSLQHPDWEYWSEHFPNGLGASAFSAPSWQRLMAHEISGRWEPKVLEIQTGDDRRLTLPVLVRRDRWKRFEITVRPVAYFVSPIEGGVVDDGMVQSLCHEIDSPFTATFAWWLPPWCSWRPSAQVHRLSHGQLRCTFINAYLITLDGSAEEHLAHRVEKPQRRRLRATLSKGLEVLSNPQDAMIDEYYELYLRVWDEQGWSGEKFSRKFFHGVARTLGGGGELLVMRYQGRVVGGGVILYDRHAVHTFQSTIDRHVEDIYPHAVFNATAIERAEKRGLRYVNFGGINEGNAGLRQYKEAWGAVETPVPFLWWCCQVPAIAKKAVSCISRLWSA